MIGNLTRRRRTTPRARFRWQSRRPIPTYSATSPTSSTAGKSRYDALQLKYEWRMGSDVTLLSSFTLSKAKDNGAGSRSRTRTATSRARRTSTTWRPSTHRRVPSAVQQHDQLRLGAAVRARQALGQRHRRQPSTSWLGGWQVAGHQHVHPRRDGDLHLRAGRGVQVSGIANDFSRREQLPAERHLRSVRAGRTSRPSTTGSTAACVADSDRSEPAVRERGAQHRARSEVLDRSISRRPSRCDLSDRVENRSCASKPSTCSTA